MDAGGDETGNKVKLSPGELLAALNKIKEKHSQDKLEEDEARAKKAKISPKSKSEPKQKPLTCTLCFKSHVFETQKQLEKHLRSHKHRHMEQVATKNQKCDQCGSLQYHTANPCRIDDCIPCNEENWPNWYKNIIKCEQIEFLQELTDDLIETKTKQNQELKRKIAAFKVLDKAIRDTVNNFGRIEEMETQEEMKEILKL